MVNGSLGQACAFELDRRMADAEVRVEFLANLLKNFFALVHVHVRDADVAGERNQVRSNRPDMNVR